MIIKKNKIKILLKLVIFLLLFLISFSKINAYNQVDSVKSAISKEYNMIKYFAKEAKIRKAEDYNAINEYMQIIAHFETRIQNDTRNSCYRNQVNTAKGYYQFLDGTYWWIYDEIHKIMPDFPEGRYIYEYSYAGQSRFAITLWKTHENRINKGIKKLNDNLDEDEADNKKDLRSFIKELYGRDYDAGLEIYCSYHHTDCDSQLSPTRYKELKSALRNWEKDMYLMTPEKREKLRIEEEKKLEKLKKELEGKIKEIKKKIEEYIKNKNNIISEKKESDKNFTKS